MVVGQGLTIICGQTLKASKVGMIDGCCCHPVLEIVNVICLIVECDLSNCGEGQVNQHVMVACVIITIVVSSGVESAEMSREVFDVYVVTSCWRMMCYLIREGASFFF